MLVDDRAERPAVGGRVLFGAAYYAEYQPTPRLDEDLDLMADAGFTVIRVGESVWSTWEPRDGVFELDWLQPVLDGAHERGMGVLLGTPTYAAPPWLQTLHPEIAAERKTGVRLPWGGRQEMDYSHPTFRFYAERVIRAVVKRYADHPAVVGFQVDNEPGMELFHNDHAFQEFVRRLEAAYGDVATLNREWGLTYWSHRIGEWTELWRPDGNTSPQYDLAWRRYQADLTSEFIGWQADIVREYARSDQFVTTCIAYGRPALDDRSLAAGLDVTAGNPYYGMQDHLAADRDLSPMTPWTTTGVWGLLRQADRMFSSRQERFLVTETNAQSIGDHSHNLPPYPGQLAQAALTLVSRGATMIEYWHWHTLHFGTETYWGGVLPHSQRPGRVYREVAEIGRLFETLGDTLEGYAPDSDIAIVHSQDSKWALEFSPALTDASGAPDRESYTRIFDAFYRGIVDSGAQARVLHLAQLLEGSATDAAERHPVLVVPALYIAADAELEFLGDYARAGGHLVLGVRTGYADEEARARAEVAPARLADAAGVWYEEFSNLNAPLAVRGTPAFPLSAASAATGWADGLIPTDAEVLAEYDHPQLGRFPAVTSARADAGRVTCVGTVPNPAFAADLARWLVPDPIGRPWSENAGPAVRMTSGRLPGGRRASFLFNWSSDAAELRVPADQLDPLTTETVAAGTVVALEPWGCRLLLDPHQLLIDDEAPPREGK